MPDTELNLHGAVTTEMVFTTKWRDDVAYSNDQRASVCQAQFRAVLRV